MSNKKCFYCGSLFTFNELENAKNEIIKCAFCGAVNQLPNRKNFEASISQLTLAHDDLMQGRFDDAYKAYRLAYELDNKNSEALFGMFLSENKIHFVLDKVTKSLKPVFHDFSLQLLPKNSNLDKAISIASDELKSYYNNKISEINSFLSSLKKINTGEFDVFLCALTKDDNGYTEDNYRAIKIYDFLTKKGFRVFYEDKYNVSEKNIMIQYALKKSKCLMIVCNDELMIKDDYLRSIYLPYINNVKYGYKAKNSVSLIYIDNESIDSLNGFFGFEKICYKSFDASKKILSFAEANSVNIAFDDSNGLLTSDEKDYLYGQLNAKQSKNQQKTVINDSYFVSFNRGATIENGVLTSFKGDVEKLYVPTNVIEINPKVFLNNFNLREIHFYGHLIKIGREAFKGCRNLKIVEFNNGIDEIEDFAFNNCSSLENINIPSTVKRIGKGSFVDAKKVTIDENFKYKVIGGCICDMTAGSIISGTSVNVLPGDNDIKKIDDYAFYNSFTLDEITIPKNIQKLGVSTFENCLNLRIVHLQGIIKEISRKVFKDCGSIFIISLPEGTENIKEYAFENCVALNKFEFPKTIKRIDDNAFAGCVSLKQVSLHGGFEQICDNAFARCYVDEVECIGFKLFETGKLKKCFKTSKFKKK